MCFTWAEFHLKFDINSCNAFGIVPSSMYTEQFIEHKVPESKLQCIGRPVDVYFIL